MILFCKMYSFKTNSVMGLFNLQVIALAVFFTQFEIKHVSLSTINDQLTEFLSDL